MASLSSFGAETYSGVDDNGKDCTLTIYQRNSNGMTIKTSHTKKMFVSHAIYRQGNELILEKSELRDTEINRKLNVHEKILSVTLDVNNEPTSYSYYSRGTVPLLGPILSKFINCRL